MLNMGSGMYVWGADVRGPEDRSQRFLPMAETDVRCFYIPFRKIDTSYPMYTRHQSYSVIPENPRKQKWKIFSIMNMASWTER